MDNMLQEKNISPIIINYLEPQDLECIKKPTSAAKSNPMIPQNPPNKITIGIYNKFSFTKSSHTHSYANDQDNELNNIYMDKDDDKNDSESSYGTGRWKNEEHQRFISSLEVYGKNWKKIQECVVTRSTTQIRSHAQKYFYRIERKTNKARCTIAQRDFDGNIIMNQGKTEWFYKLMPEIFFYKVPKKKLIVKHHQPGKTIMYPRTRLNQNRDKIFPTNFQNDKISVSDNASDYGIVIPHKFDVMDEPWEPSFELADKTWNESFDEEQKNKISICFEPALNSICDYPNY